LLQSPHELPEIFQFVHIPVQKRQVEMRRHEVGVVAGDVVVNFVYADLSIKP
jgi:hypothetical protein